MSSSDRDPARAPGSLAHDDDPAHGPAHDHAHSHDHDHDHAHAHAHDHDHGPPPAVVAPPSSASVLPAPPAAFTAREAGQARRLLLVLIAIAAFSVVEFVGAIKAGSNALQLDALHLVMDIFALSLSLGAMRLAIRPPTARFTFGLRRAEPVGAIVNALLVCAGTAHFVYEGIEALEANTTPRATIMLYVAVGALIVNGFSAWVLHGAIHHAPGHDHGHAPHAHAHAHDHAHGAHARDPAHVAAKHHAHALNLRGAWLHLLGDTLGSVAALVAAVVIRLGGPGAVDPIASFLIAAILLFGAFRLMRDAVVVLLEAAPVHLPVGAVREVIRDFPGVARVERLHVWTLGAGHDAITAHVRAPGADAGLASRIAARLRQAFEAEHVTVQVDVD